jgi:hypothetical protein
MILWISLIPKSAPTQKIGDCRFGCLGGPVLELDTKCRNWDSASWTYSHAMLWVHKNKNHGPLFIVWVFCWVFFLLWLVWHLVALPNVIRGPCLVSRDYAYMGTCHKYHVMDASLSLLCWCWNHHLVTNSILLNLKFFIWPQIYLYNAMFVLFFIQMSV